jgi:hypothetical protein
MQMRGQIFGIVALFIAGGEAVADEKRPPPPWMVEGFVAAVEGPDTDVIALQKTFAPWLLRAISIEQSRGVIDKVLLLLESSDMFVRDAAVQALTNMPLGDRANEAMDKLITLLTSQPDGESIAGDAIGVLASRDRSGIYVEKVLGLLDSPRPLMQAKVTKALGTMPLGDHSNRVIEKITPLLGSSDSRLQTEAAKALARMPLGDHLDQVMDKLVSLLQSSEDVRESATNTLATLASGDHASHVTDKLLPLLHASRGDVRRSAIQALAAVHGDRTGDVIDNLLPLLSSKGGIAGSTIPTIEALGAMPLRERSGKVIDNLFLLLRSPDKEIQATAARALAAMPLDNRKSGAVIGRLLNELDAGDAEAAAGALAAMPLGNQAGQVTDKLVDRLMVSTEIDEQVALSQALVKLVPSVRADHLIDRILEVMEDPDPYPGVSAAAAHVLAVVPPGNRVGKAIDELQKLLGERRGYVVAEAARALGTMPLGERADKIITELTMLLSEHDGVVRQGLEEALVALPLGNNVEIVTSKIMEVLSTSDDATVRALNSDDSDELAAANFLAKNGPYDASWTIDLLKAIHDRGPEDAPGFRAVAYIATSADVKGEGTKTLLAWLGRPKALPLQLMANKPREAYQVLKTLETHWSEIADHPSLRREAEERVINIVDAACPTRGAPANAERWIDMASAWLRDLTKHGLSQGCWTNAQRRTLEHFIDGFQDTAYTDALKVNLAGETMAPALKSLIWSFLGWSVFWATFLLAFPRSRTVQAVFFWNPKVRDMLSLWFVPFLLIIIPPLRRRLLIPFRDDLVAAARLGEMQRLAFFGQSRARAGDDPPVEIEKILQGLQGVVILRGDAGLGKTSALRWFTARSTRPVAFLVARDCAAGVDVVIARLIHDIQETSFVRSLVHTRALVVVVDGLNEVSADTREKITAFAREMSKGDVFIGTQPIEWTPPPGARIVDLLPLDYGEAKRFLLSRPVGADVSQNVHGSAYADAVDEFLRRALIDAPTDEDRKAATMVLSNPFDLTFAADLLVQGAKPSATALIDEAFRLADEGAVGEPGYRDVAGQPFPSTRFGRLATEMRLEDRNWFKPEEFAAELPCLLQRRLLVRRAVSGPSGVEERIQFRHDRVWDFFIASAFLNDPELWFEHLADPRFRGVYLRIAETWPPDAAIKVRDQLVIAAAERGDHTTSDEFIKRLEARRRLLGRSESHLSELKDLEKSL